MTMEPRHYEDEIQEMVSGRLQPELRAEVERHVATCVGCRRTLERLSLLRKMLRAGLPSNPVPGEIVAGVAAALDREDRHRSALRHRAPAAGPRRRGALAWLALTTAAAALILVLLAGRRGLVPAASQDFADYAKGALALGERTNDPAQLETFFRRSGIPFRARVLDLGMMGYQLVGGQAHTLAGRPSALFVYRGPGGRTLVCQMYEGRTSELPRAPETRRHGDFTFSVYRRDKQTLVFWQEGRLTCVLASDGDPEEVIQLAFAKAMKA